MSPEVLTKICQPYGTVNNQNMNNYGTGIGLFTSQIITSQIGPCDKILISSRLKKGSEFSFLTYQNAENKEIKDEIKIFKNNKKLIL